MDITAVWLMSEEKDIVVLVEVDGVWYEAIRTFAPLNEMTISHCVHTKNELPPDCQPVDYLNEGKAKERT